MIPENDYAYGTGPSRAQGRVPGQGDQGNEPPFASKRKGAPLSSKPRLSEEEWRIVKSVLEQTPLIGVHAPSLGALWRRWIRFVREVERGYSHTIYDYTNDLSVRDTLERVTSSVPDHVRTKLLDSLRPWDDRFYQATKRIAEPLRQDPATGDAAPWWYRIPRVAGDELREDLWSEGYLL